MSTKVYHFEINWPQVLLSSAMASAASTFILAGDVAPNLSDLVIGTGLLAAAELAASYILFSLSTRHKN
jgi:hypothetical protein